VSEAGELEALGERRFRLRHDVTVLSRDEGVVVVGPTTSLELKSRSIGQAIGWLWPRLDGTRPLDTLTADLDPGTRGAMARLVARLHQGGMLLDLAEEDPRRLAVLDSLYPEQISFLAHRSGAPVAAFDRFRRARFLVRGEGVVLRNVAAALADYGAIDARFDSPSDTALVRLVEAANSNDPERRFAIDSKAGPTESQSGFDVLIEAGADSVDGGMALLCTEAPAPARMAGIYRLGDRLAVLLSLSEGGETPCFAAFAAAAGPDPGGEPVAPAAAAIAAHHCVAALFGDLCGIAEPQPPSLLEIDQDRLTSRLRRLDPDPHCKRHGHPVVRTALAAEEVAAPEPGFPRPDVPDGGAATSEIYDSIHRASTALAAPVGSAIFDIGEGELAQMPFARSAASWRLPPSAGGTAERVVCAALSAREARNQAVLLAAERWAAVTLGPPTEDVAAIGAGWSPAEAAYRALESLACRADDGEEVKLALPELVRHGPTIAHLVEMAAVLGGGYGGGELAAAPAAGGGWLAWRAGESSGASAFGATPGQALGNCLFRTLVAQLSGEAAQPAGLACGAKPEDVGQLILTASRWFDFTEIASPALAHDSSGARLRLVEARRRPA
jgi:hypothetical protein